MLFISILQKKSEFKLFDAQLKVTVSLVVAIVLSAVREGIGIVFVTVTRHLDSEVFQVVPPIHSPVNSLFTKNVEVPPIA